MKRTRKPRRYVLVVESSEAIYEEIARFFGDKSRESLFDFRVFSAHDRDQALAHLEPVFPSYGLIFWGDIEGDCLDLIGQATASDRHFFMVAMGKEAPDVTARHEAGCTCAIDPEEPFRQSLEGNYNRKWHFMTTMREEESLQTRVSTRFD